MICSLFLIILFMLAVLFLWSHYHLENCFINFVLLDNLLISSCRKNCCFVKQIFKVCTCKSIGGLCHSFNRYTFCKRFIFGMNLKNCFSALLVGIINYYLTIKSAGTKKCRVENVRTVSSSDYNNTFVSTESVHLNEELVKCLLAFIMTAAKTCAALSAHCVYFIDKNNCRKVLSCLFKKVAHTTCTDTYKHLNKIRA